MSQQSGKLMPNLDQQSTKLLNLTVLQRIDPFVEEILITAAHVTFYEFNIDLSQWSRKDVEGSLFVVKRNTQPRFQFIVMNRRNTDNLVENLLGDFEYEVQAPYLLYRNASQEVNGIWFYNARECEDVANLFNSFSCVLMWRYELEDHTHEVNVQHEVLDGMFTFYDLTKARLAIYQVASVTFDLLLLLVLGSYLIVLFSFLVITTRGLDDLISIFRRPPSRKVKTA
ncbi:mrna-decapping enzyme-like protein [Quercus suber]|uniref:Mrna-decapping enzyme-like protein n=1 Tax=Quercus suber TaxID=58331 RepID=A0AAW0LPQ6_QUESU